MPIGCKVTLRRERMYEFLDRLVNVALPRVRDFRGVSPKSFDGRGNFALGIREQIVFPEINYDEIDEIARHGHHHLHDGPDRRRRPRRFSKASACRSGSNGATIGHGEEERRREERARRKLVQRHAAKRAELKKVVMDRSREPEERFEATLKLAAMPRNGARVRIRNRCMLTGRPRGLLPEVRSVAHRAARTGLGRARSRAWSRRAGKRGNAPMAMSDPLGDMLTRIRNGQMAQKARGRRRRPPSCARNVLEVLRREGYIRGYRGRRARRRQARALDRAQVPQWRAGDPRAAPGLQARPARSTRAQGPAAASITASASPSCRRRAASCPTPRRARRGSAARSCARCSEPCRASASIR